MFSWWKRVKDAWKRSGEAREVPIMIQTVADEAEAYAAGKRKRAQEIERNGMEWLAIREQERAKQEQEERQRVGREWMENAKELERLEKELEARKHRKGLRVVA